MISLPEGLGPMNSTCPMYQLLDMLGKKWMLFLLILLFEGEQTFNSLSKKMEINGKTLTERLDLLLEKGYLKRKISSNKPIRVTYELTSEGRELTEHIIGIGEWRRKKIKSI